MCAVLPLRHSTALSVEVASNSQGNITYLPIQHQCRCKPRSLPTDFSSASVKKLQAGRKNLQNRRVQREQAIALHRHWDHGRYTSTVLTAVGWILAVNTGNTHTRKKRGNLLSRKRMLWVGCCLCRKMWGGCDR